MSTSFFPKSAKFDVDVRNAEKNWDNVLHFGESFISIDFVKDSVLLREKKFEKIFWVLEKIAF